MEKDIPKATIIVLLVLTVLVSVIGTWTVLESISIKETSPAQKTAGSTNEDIEFNMENTPELVETNANIKLEIKQ